MLLPMGFAMRPPTCIFDVCGHGDNPRALAKRVDYLLRTDGHTLYNYVLPPT